MEWSPCQWWWIGRRICKEKNYRSAEIWQRWGQISLGEPFYWLRSVTKPRLKTSPLGSQSHSLLCVWQNNKSKALNLKVSFNTVSKTNFHLFVSAIYHLHLIQLCPLHKRLGSARESKRARVFAWLRVHTGSVSWGGQVRVEGASPHSREVGITFGNSHNKRKCEGETEREKEKPDNRCKKTCTQVKTKAASPNQEWEIGWPLRGGGVGSAFTSRNGSQGVRKWREWKETTDKLKKNEQHRQTYTFLKQRKGCLDNCLSVRELN